MRESLLILISLYLLIVGVYATPVRCGSPHLLRGAGTPLINSADSATKLLLESYLHPWSSEIRRELLREAESLSLYSAKRLVLRWLWLSYLNGVPPEELRASFQRLPRELRRVCLREPRFALLWAEYTVGLSNYKGLSSLLNYLSELYSGEPVYLYLKARYFSSSGKPESALELLNGIDERTLKAMSTSQSGLYSLIIAQKLSADVELGRFEAAYEIADELWSYLLKEIPTALRQKRYLQLHHMLTALDELLSDRLILGYSFEEDARQLEGVISELVAATGRCEEISTAQLKAIVIKLVSGCYQEDGYEEALRLGALSLRSLRDDDLLWITLAGALKMMIELRGAKLPDELKEALPEERWTSDAILKRLESLASDDKPVTYKELGDLYLKLSGVQVKRLSPDDVRRLMIAHSLGLSGSPLRGVKLPYLRRAVHWWKLFLRHYPDRSRLWELCGDLDLLLWQSGCAGCSRDAVQCYLRAAKWSSSPELRLKLATVAAEIGDDELLREAVSEGLNLTSDPILKVRFKMLIERLNELNDRSKPEEKGGKGI